MRMYDIIAKKKNGGALTPAEMSFWVQGFVRDTIPDYQVAALLMAIFFQGLSLEETSFLTETMIHSGETVDLSPLPGIKADKHSTGGVGDKTTLILAPLLASMGITVAKMSGRGLGHTGGTLDKLESIPGFRVDLSREAFMANVRDIGLAIIGQTANLVPADKKLYALRDVTATVESVPLIAASVMSKKLAAGADIIVLDVKYGSGAFMKTSEQAECLARMMVGIGEHMGKKVAALITGMDRPLGAAVGNALEVKEAIHVLKGQGPADVRELCLRLAGVILWLSGKAADVQGGEKLAARHLDDGSALGKLRELIVGQGGNSTVIEEENLLPDARYRFSFLAEQDAYIDCMNTEAIGIAAMKLGAGRERKEDGIDPGVGIIFHKKTGDWVKKGETIGMIHANDEDRADEGMELLKKSIFFHEQKKELQPFIYRMVLDKEGSEFLA